MRTFARSLVTVLLLCMIVGCQGIGTSDQFSPVKEDEIFLISDGVLTSYLGSDSEIRIPEDVVAIGPDAFTTSTATNNVSKISFGRNVEIIDPAAFRGLPNLKSVDIYAENPFFLSGKDEFGTGGFICGTREPIVFYFPGEDDAVRLSHDDGTSPYFYGETEEMLFVCHGAVFSLQCKTIGKQIHWYCSSIQYQDNSVDFQTSVEFEGGNYQTYLFETSDLELVFETVSYNFSDAWMLTENMVMELHPGSTPGYSISLYHGDDGTLRYHKIKAEYSTQEQADEISQRITSRDNYYGEDGKAYVSNGEWKFIAEKRYTVSDYFRMIGTNIDDWFLSLNSPYSTLEQLMEANKRCEAEYIDVLQGNRQFCDAASGRYIYFPELKEVITPDDLPLNVQKFCLIDLTQSGRNDLVLQFSFADNQTAGFVILHCQDDIVYSYTLSHRSMSELKGDGTFIFSGGASNWGVGKLVFSKDGFSIDEISYCSDSSYFVDKVSTTREEFENECAIQDAKENAEWFDFTAESVGTIEKEA